MGDQRAADVKRAGFNRKYNPPGPIVAILTALPVGLLFCLHYGLWPSRFGSFQWAEPFLFFAGALLALGVLGLVWAIRTLIFVVEERRWSWWILLAPLIVLGAVVLGAAVPPTPFDEMRPEFEQVARELLASPGSDRARENVEIGRFDISRVFEGRDSEVYFREEPWLGFGTSTGWVYSPNGEPSGFDDFSSTDLGGPWYEYKSVWRD
ncbi:DUF1109 domain-containing protein [Rhodococcus sp. OK519]|uniref:DUF1109 domain-containing protein n=1 Tax=Rhodococcus sp. OK519 TaxID=2135729 RepID=UPI000D364BFF